MQTIVDFFSHPFFSVVGGIFSLLTLLGFIASIFWIIKGVIPVWYRLGLSLSKRKIAIYADDRYDELKSILVDSGLFREKNIFKIGENDYGKIADFSLIIIHYKSAQSLADKILETKRDASSMIFFAPPDDGRVPPEHSNVIQTKRNTVLVNYRGRLLGDVFTAMITSK